MTSDAGDFPSGEKLLWQIASSNIVRSESWPAVFAYVLNGARSLGGEEYRRIVSRSASLLRLLAVTRLDLRTQACAMREFGAAGLRSIRTSFFSAIEGSEGCSAKILEQIRMWVGEEEEQFDSVFIPAVGTQRKPFQSLSEVEVCEILLRRVFGVDLDKVVNIISDCLEELFRSSNVSPLQRELTIKLLPYADCTLLGILFYGIRNKLRERLRLDVEIRMMSLFGDGLFEKQDLAIGYATVRDLPDRNPTPLLGGKLLASSAVRAALLRRSGLEACPVAHTETGGGKKRFLQGLTLLGEYADWEGVFEIANSIRVRLAVPREQRDLIGSLLVWGKELLILQAASRLWAQALVITPDLFVWAREAGILQWRAMNSTIQAPQLKALRPLSYGSREGELSALVLYGSGGQLEPKDFQRKTVYFGALENLVMETRAALKRIQKDALDVIDKLEEEREETSERAEIYRDCLMSVLRDAAGGFGGVLPLLSPRGLMSNMFKMEKYADYEPAASLQLSYLSEGAKRERSKRKVEGGEHV